MGTTLMLSTQTAKVRHLPRPNPHDFCRTGHLEPGQRRLHRLYSNQAYRQAFIMQRMHHY